MSKNGKIIAVVAFVLSLAVAASAFLAWKQSKAHAKRFQELAGVVSSTAGTLDSGSGNASKLAFSTDEKGKETGALGWEATKGVEGATANAAAPLSNLASDVITQREEIINNLIEKVANPLECPADKLPNADMLNNLNEYGEGLDAFGAYINDRVARDNKVKASLNQVLRTLNVRGTYTGTVNTNGEFSSSDRQAFADAGKNLGSLKANYALMAQTMRELSNTLRSAQVSGVQWESPRAISNIGSTGLTESETAANQNVAAQFKADFATLKTQLARIDDLENDKLDLQEEMRNLNAKIDSLKNDLTEAEKVLGEYFARGLSLNKAEAKSEPPKSFDDIQANLSGYILKVDAKYGYVVINLTEYDVLPELRMAVYRQGKYIGQLKVMTTTAFNSLATVDNGKLEDFMTGDSVVIGSRSLQPADL